MLGTHPGATYHSTSFPGKPPAPEHPAGQGPCRFQAAGTNCSVDGGPWGTPRACRAAQASLSTAPTAGMHFHRRCPEDAECFLPATP